MSLAKEILERLVTFSKTHPVASVQRMEDYGWWDENKKNHFKNPQFPNHSMTVHPEHVEHTNELGVKVQVPHDDFNHYVRGMALAKANVKPDWDAEDEDDDDKPRKRTRTGRYRMKA